jgi:hypothetical protein
MKKFSNQFKTKITGEHSGNFWQFLLQWLRLLTLSLTRVKDILFAIFFPNSIDPVTSKWIEKAPSYNQLLDRKKPSNMKPGSRILQFALILLLAVLTKNATAQTPYQKTGDQTVCVNSTEPYGVGLNAGSNYAWTITPLTGGNGTITPGATPNLITVNWTAVGTAKLQVKETNPNGCDSTVSIVVTVTPINTVTAASSSPTACVNTPITNITHTTTGATGIGTPTGLPAGVTAVWSNNTITISGTPTDATGSPFNYTIPLTGGCGNVNATGTITVTPANTITLTSGAATTSQTVCVNTAITNITYATTGATGATFSGLPAGVTGSWAGNVVTISGTPTTATGSPFNYTVTLTGGCGTVTTTGTIAVTPLPVVTAPTSICIGTTGILSPSSVGTWTSSDPSIATVTDAGVITGVAIGSATFTYKQTATGCTATTSPVTITPKPATTPITHN